MPTMNEEQVEAFQKYLSDEIARLTEKRMAARGSDRSWDFKCYLETLEEVEAEFSRVLARGG